MEENLTKRVIQGAALVIAVHGLSMAIRLGGNIILTRLLVPEFFGIMALAGTFVNGLHFFSDIGIGPGIIRSPRGHDPVFLNTAWTLQVIRGIILWLATLALALPAANIYGNPVLAWVVPALGLNAILFGLNSTSIHTLNKDIYLGKISAIELIAKIISLIFMIYFAYIYKNIWSLVIGSIAGTLFTTVSSHFLEKNTINRLELNKDSLVELISYGKWIFISTSMMFLATQADRLLLGKFFPLVMFGVYSIAVTFAELPKQVINQLSGKVIFPLISKYSNIPRNELRQKILQKRKLTLAPLALVIALFACFGDVVISLLYDQRYQQAGWMLCMLAIGMWPLVLYSTIDKALYAIGKPNYSAAGNFLKFIYMIILIPFSFNIAGFMGAVLIVAMNDVPVYISTSIGLSREKLSCFRQDIIATLFLLGMVSIFLAIRYFFDLGFPGMAVF